MINRIVRIKVIGSDGAFFFCLNIVERNLR